MTVYIPTTLAASFCKELESLALRPGQPPAEEASPMFAIITDLHGDCWLEIGSCASMVLHPAADLGGLVDLVQPWMDDGLLPADTLIRLLALLESRRGESLFMHEAFPQAFNDQAKSHEQMIDAGLLAPRAAPGPGHETETMVTLTLLTAP